MVSTAPPNSNGRGAWVEANGAAAKSPAPAVAALLADALQYAASGGPVLPCLPCTKKPLPKAWQHAATTDPAQIERWWAPSPTYNVGVLLGPKSGIIDVECDSEEAERELGVLLGVQAPVVPTFRGKRGKHRLFRYQTDLPYPDKAFFKFCGVEFRTGNGGKGAQSLFPSSIHPGGQIYAWLVHPDDADPAPFPAEALAIIRGAMDAGSRLQHRGTQRDTEGHRDTTPLESSAPLLRPSVLQAIESTLPTGPGKRRRRIFDLCRQLKALPDLASADLAILRPIVVEWHRRALPVIGTKPFTDSWADFIDAWQRVKFPAGKGVVEAAFNRALQRKPPRKVAELYTEPSVHLLASLCRELQSIAGDGPFFLDCRTAGRLVGVHHTTVWRLLTVVLPADGILAGGAKGSKATRKANEYRYVNLEK
jgi:hypothetical protein